ncbi:MAG: GIDE domain-containing protein [Candidatus Micrarchaeota archaeon]
MTNSEVKALILLISGFLIGISFIINSLLNYRLLQKIKNTPTSKVEAVAMGLSEVYGESKMFNQVLSPIAKQKCVYWEINAQYYKSGKYGGWKEFYTSKSTDKFYIKDETGKILIDPTGSQIEIPEDKVYKGYISGKGVFGVSHKKIESSVLEYIETLKEKDKKSFMDHQNLEVMIYEYFIAENEMIYVLGTATPYESVENSIIIKKEKPDNILYIMDKHETEITQEMGSGVKTSLVIGLIISTICLFLLLTMFKI